MCAFLVPRPFASSFASPPPAALLSIDWPAGFSRSISQELQVPAREFGLKHEALSLGHRLSGSLTIRCFSVLATYVLPDLLATCAERYPLLRVHTKEVDPNALADGVLTGRLKLAWATS